VFATYQTKSYEKLCHGDIQIPHRYRIGESDHEWSRKPSIQSLCHGALLNESQTGKNAISTVNGPSRESRLKGPRSTGQLKYSLLQPATWLGVRCTRTLNKVHQQERVGIWYGDIASNFASYHLRAIKHVRTSICLFFSHTVASKRLHETRMQAIKSSKNFESVYWNIDDLSPRPVRISGSVWTGLGLAIVHRDIVLLWEIRGSQTLGPSYGNLQRDDKIEWTKEHRGKIFTENEDKI